jgi:hypothetical protein
MDHVIICLLKDTENMKLYLETDLENITKCRMYYQA